MKKTAFSLFVILSSFQYLHAQSPAIEVEKWTEKPTLHTIEGKYAKESAIVLFDKRMIEFTDDAKKEVFEYYTTHRIVHINDDRGIEEFNKIYLGVSENADLVDVRARTILPSGKIIELNKNNIKDIKESDGNTYKIFAMDGLEKGCEIEYFYTAKRPTSYFGREVVQGRSPVEETLFEIVAPARLRFEIKPYNFSITAADTVLNGKRIAQCDFKGTDAAETEKYAYEDADLRRLEFKLSYNDEARKGERLFTWTELAKRVYGIYTYYTDKEAKLAADIADNNGWDKLTTETLKITAVENYVKSHFSYNEELRSDDGNKLENVIHKKIGGIIGLTRLYSAIFQHLGIDYQFVLTGDRSKFIIDRQFENWNNCDYPLFYFPAENKFISATRPDVRYPWIVPTWGNTNGLFCKRTTLGSFSTAIADVRPIALEDYSKSLNNIETKIEFNKTLDSLTIDSKQIFTGYVAVEYRDIFNFANEDQKKSIVKELVKRVSNSENILSTEILNPEFEKANNNTPVVLATKTKSGELIEKAGAKILVKIGLTIGPQVEMYQEKPRQTPIDIDYGHVEARKIELVIPEGYKINNLNDIKIDQTYKENGELTMGFVSGYELKGNLLSINIMEEYRKTYYPVEQFDQFRKIINASSDFNKVVLVLEKK